MTDNRNNNTNNRRNSAGNSAGNSTETKGIIAAGSSLADYRRILSYLYRYENANRKSCCGFIKAEQKSGNLKLTAQIDDNRLLNGMTLKLYFYEKQDEGFKLWHLFNLTAESNQKEWQISFAENELPAGFSVIKQSGVVLFYQESYYYGSVWVGEEIPKGLFSGKQRQEAREQELSSEKIDGQKPDEGQAKTESKTEEGQAKVMPEPEAGAEEKPETVRKAETEVKAKAEAKPGEKIDSEAEAEPETETKPQAEIKKKTGSEKKVEEKAVLEDHRETAETESAAKTAKTVKTEETEILQEEPQVMSCESENSAVDRLEKMWINSAENRQPVDNIFNPAFYKGYKISVGQLKEMGEEAAAFSENQFLLKGYQRYHHLLAGKVRYGGGDRYCVGVPGIYENREKYMAEIYQFPIFLSLTENRIKTGGFGYWLHILSEE